MKIKIEPLTKDRIEEGIQFIHKVFNSNPEDWDSSERWFPASLDPEKYKKYYDELKVEEVKYFLAIDENTNKIVGTTGYYTHTNDKNEADWLAWFSVDPKYRKQGLGTKLLNYIKDLAKKRGKKFLRLYTTDSSEEEVAQKFYDFVGLKVVKEETTDEYKRGTKKIYREMEL